MESVNLYPTERDPSAVTRYAEIQYLMPDCVALAVKRKAEIHY